MFYELILEKFKERSERVAEQYNAMKNLIEFRRFIMTELEFAAKDGNDDKVWELYGELDKVEYDIAELEHNELR